MDKKIVLQGFIVLLGEGSHIAIGNDYIAESLLDTDGQIVSVRYWIADSEITQEEAEQAYQEIAMGGKSECEFAVRYSDYTGYLWTDENLNVGGHDLIAELENYVGKYLILEVVIHGQSGE